MLRSGLEDASPAIAVKEQICCSKSPKLGASFRWSLRCHVVVTRTPARAVPSLAKPCASSSPAGIERYFEADAGVVRNVPDLIDAVALLSLQIRVAEKRDH